VGHATLLAQHFALEGYHAVVAVGGDDTVNEVATGLVGSNTALGVVPNGSSNGFARHIDISTRMNRAIEMLNSSEAIYVDYATINDRPFSLFSVSDIMQQSYKTSTRLTSVQKTRHKQLSKTYTNINQRTITYKDMVLI
jgi:diacylglycerol kinase family enzyme